MDVHLIEQHYTGLNRIRLHLKCFVKMDKMVLFVVYLAVYCKSQIVLKSNEI